MIRYIFQILIFSICHSLLFADGGLCERHIYNKSEYTRFMMINNSGKGYATFHKDTIECINVSPDHFLCIIPPGPSTLYYIYNGGGAVDGDIGFYDSLNSDQTDVDYSTGWSYHYFNGSLGPVLGQCPYINHNGHTPAFSVNDPADGDWNLWCKEAKFSSCK